MPFNIHIRAHMFVSLADLYYYTVLLDINKWASRLSHMKVLLSMYRILCSHRFVVILPYSSAGGRGSHFCCSTFTRTQMDKRIFQERKNKTLMTVLYVTLRSLSLIVFLRV